MKHFDNIKNERFNYLAADSVTEERINVAKNKTHQLNKTGKIMHIRKLRIQVKKNKDSRA